ncbi:DUF1491 family protein [Aliihoeflea aestuarii]|jgi:hypothetical protein|uniref:DUF1491 family protein n=1 Tax=Aliihoeflea aestuarii TaxID=453840 RepID=UPI0020936DB5|nr:DUF1491 family protein [Aliihoeflea aestuarii]MCO6389522.1 DUF1491 family protein [Aliihoeflea aestuarii]
MRVTTDLWVSAVLRRVFAAGGYGAVIKRGASEAGAVFVIVRSRFGTATLHAPRAQSDYAQARPDDRMFSPVLTDVDDDAIEARLEKERRFDPDLWVIEIEADARLVEELL